MRCVVEPQFVGNKLVSDGQIETKLNFSKNCCDWDHAKPIIRNCVLTSLDEVGRQSDTNQFQFYFDLYGSLHFLY